MSRWIGSFILAGLIAIGGTRGAESPATTQAAAAATPAEEKKPEPRCRMVDLFRIDLRQRRLDVAFLPPAWSKAGGGSGTGSGNANSLLAEGSGDDRWYIEATPRDRRDDGSYNIFQVSCDDRMDDRWSPLRLVLVSRGEDDALSISGLGRVDSAGVTVTYTQDANGGLVHFSVQRQRRRMRPIHEFDAPDLFSLWNDHPKELRQYLLPLLHEISLKNPLAPRAGDVYRAFTSIPADEQTTQKLGAILPALDADDAKERESAAAKLEALGAPGILAAVRLDPSTLTPEQRGRLETLVNSHSLIADPAALAKRDPRFLADCLEDEDVRVRSAALDGLCALTGRKIAFDVAAADPADRTKAAAAVVDALDDLSAPNNTAQPAGGAAGGAGFNP